MRNESLILVFALLTPGLEACCGYGDICCMYPECCWWNAQPVLEDDLPGDDLWYCEEFFGCGGGLKVLLEYDNENLVNISREHVMDTVGGTLHPLWARHAQRLVRFPKDESHFEVPESAVHDAQALISLLQINTPCGELASQPACPPHSVESNALIFDFSESRITYFDVVITNNEQHDDLKCVARAMGDGDMDLTMKFDMSNGTEYLNYQIEENKFEFTIGCTQAGTLHGKLKNLRVRCNHGVEFSDPLCYDCGCGTDDGLIPVCRNGQRSDIPFEEKRDGDTSPDCDTCRCNSN